MATTNQLTNQMRRIWKDVNTDGKNIKLLLQEMQEIAKTNKWSFSRTIKIYYKVNNII